MAGSGVWGMQPQCLHPLLADAQTTEGAAGFFFSAIRVNFSAGIITFASKNFIASLLVEIGNLGALFVWNRKGSERPEK